MDVADKSRFLDCAINSGLLIQEDIDAAVETLRARALEGAAGDPATGIDELAAVLIEQEKLNAWHVQQLLRGRTKFNLGPYKILDAIGQGGMGHVFKAEHTIMGRIVAVKVLPKQKSTPEAIRWFSREIRAQAKLDHDNLVRAYDAGQDGNVHFLVTEYVPGADLRKLTREHGRLSMQTAATIVAHAARGLDHAHSRGLIHRDVKPGNLLVMPDGRTKVSDLGLAGFFGEEHGGEGLGSKVVGTADYLSPDQIVGPEKVTPTSDIYSLGCTLYYAVTGKVPFPGGTVKDKCLAHCQKQPIDPRRLNPALSDAFVEILSQMMAKEPAKRIQTAAEVADRLWPFAQPSRPADLDETAFTVATPAIVLGGELDDTATAGLGPIDGGEEIPLESPSQVSQTTHPFAAATEETLSIPEIFIGDPRRSTEPAIPPWVVVLILVGSAAAIVALSAVLGSLF